MDSTKQLILLVLLALLLCAVTAEARGRRLRADSNRKTNFDFFFLVRQWPATFCNDHHCTHRPPAKYAFTVHGMWPQRRDGSWPEYCNPSDHLRMDEVDDLVDELEKEWPSWSSSDEVFWDHEWSRHGTCAAPVTGTQHRFFQTVLSLHDKFNIQDALKAAGITPSNSHRYPVQDIKDAIEARYGVMPHVTCDNKGELSEVWMCINKKLRAIDCVEDPRPPHTSSRGAAASYAGDADEATSAPVPPNYNCQTVIIPKLQRHWGKLPDLSGVQAAAGVSSTQNSDALSSSSNSEHAQGMDDQQAAQAAELVSGASQYATEPTAVQQELSALLTAVGEPVLAAGADVAHEAQAMATVSDSTEQGPAEAAAGIVAALAAVEQASVAVTQHVAEAVVATTAAIEAAAAAASSGDSSLEASTSSSNPAAVVTQVSVTSQDLMLQQPSTKEPNQASTQQEPHGALNAQAASLRSSRISGQQTAAALRSPDAQLPLLAGVVIAIVAAAILAAAVALGAQPCAGEGGAAQRKGVTGTYVPPAVAEPEGPADAMPLLADTPHNV